MKYGPFIFLGVLSALALSWLGMIATPQLQLGNEQPTNVPPSNVLYPIPAPGVANLGREVYRANGCAYCHSQVVRQDGARFEVVITEPGTNAAPVVEGLVQIRKDLGADAAQKLIQSMPATVLNTDFKVVADEAQKILSAAGAEILIRLIPTGSDIQRGWGTRMTVARDYLYQTPLMLGSTRIGPDLTNVGLRQPDAVWHLIHLYDPRLKVEKSIMPRYPFLFEKKPRGAGASPGALPIAGNEEVIPTREAHALVAYLLSLRAELPLFEAPTPQAAASKGPSGGTNGPPASGSNTNLVPGVIVPNTVPTNPVAPP